MKHVWSALTGIAVMGLVGCGPTVDGSDFPATCEAVASHEACGNGTDDDCDGAYDCADPDCAGVAACAGGCGERESPEASMSLPDGEGVAYESSLQFSAFADGQRLLDANAFAGVCVVMEHSWLRDLQIELTCPSGQVVVLQQFLGQEGAEVVMGQPYHNDNIEPQPGQGWEYCWRNDADNPPMLEWANSMLMYGSGTLPEGDYRPVTSFAALEGCDLNGEWTLRVEDLWAADNGFIFQWKLDFDESLVPDCGVW